MGTYDFTEILKIFSYGTVTGFGLIIFITLISIVINFFIRLFK